MNLNGAIGLSSSSNVFLMLAVAVAAVGGYRFFLRERKARVLSPIKIRREEKPRVVRRRY